MNANDFRNRGAEPDPVKPPEQEPPSSIGVGTIVGVAFLIGVANAVWNNIWRAKSEMGGEDAVPFWRVKVQRENESKKR